MKTKISALVAVAVMAFAATVYGADVGDKAPKLGELTCQTGNGHCISSAEEKAVVVVFTCNTCPVAIDFEDSLISFAKDYKGKDVKLMAVNVSARETAKDAALRAEEKGFNFPYLRDESQEWAKAFGATVTPHVFIMNAEREIVYAGAFADDAKNPEKNYVRDAVDSVLADKDVAVKSSKAFGCGIKWAKK